MELGPEVSKVFIFPRVKSIAERIDNISETPHPPPAPDKIAANHIKLLLLVRKLISIGLCDNWFARQFKLIPIWRLFI